MKKNELNKDQGLRLAVEHKTEAAERITLSEDFTDRLMQRIEQQDKQHQRHRVWLYSLIGVAASIILLISVGIVLHAPQSEDPVLMARTDTIKATPQTEVPKEVQKKKEQPQEKNTKAAPRTPRHYMAKAEPTEVTPKPDSIDVTALAERAFAEERRRMEMEMMAQMSGSIQSDFKALTDEIRSRGERMSQHVEMAMSNEE